MASNRFERLTPTLTSTDLRVLGQAIREAASWRGSITGDSSAEIEFDTKIKRYRQALRAARLTKEYYDVARD